MTLSIVPRGALFMHTSNSVIFLLIFFYTGMPFTYYRFPTFTSGVQNITNIHLFLKIFYLVIRPPPFIYYRFLTFISGIQRIIPNIHFFPKIIYLINSTQPDYFFLLILLFFLDA